MNSAPSLGAERLDFKTSVVAAWFTELGEGQVSVLDLGCGRAEAVADVLRHFPNVTYTGVEQELAGLEAARRNLADLPRARVVESPGEAFGGAQFDLVMSLSVLEHVKHLDEFLEASVRALLPGGRLRHRYDLGHALMPSSVGERLRVAVARRAPWAVRTQRFTTYPDLDAIVATYRSLGIEEVVVEQAQMPSLKQAVNRIDQSTPEGRALAAEVVALDRRLWEELGPELGRAERDRMFPSVQVSGRRPAG